jgi:DHA1 family bicyclomycin/chloramphenicol resistance-like MFS transporter
MQMTGLLSLLTVWLPVMAFMACFGFIGPNAQAIALEHQGHQAGMASAFYGTVAWGAAAICTVIVSALHTDSIYPMTIGISSCVTAATIVYFLMAIGRRHEQGPIDVAAAPAELPGLNASPDPLDPAEAERST